MRHDIEDLNKFVTKVVGNSFENQKHYETEMRSAMRQFHINPSKSDFFNAYRKLIDSGTIEKNESFEQYGVRKIVRSSSGVLIVTILTSPYPESNGKPGRFDCKFDCAYCPDEPGQPRSYLSTEPAVMRAIRNDYDPIKQFDDRLQALINCGHEADKIEILVLGGTWSSYPLDYRNGFITMIYYSANTFFERRLEKNGCKSVNDNSSINDVFKMMTFFLPFSFALWALYYIFYPLTRGSFGLEFERINNEKATCRIIGITLETRPDCVNPTEIKLFRSYGCTRVQLGIQHTDDEILNKINRQCKNKHNIRGIKMLKEAGFKIDIHLMPDLPGSSIEKDKEMIKYVLSSPDLQADQWKIYPCEVTPYTKIAQWYQDKTYIPYAETDFEGFKELLIWTKTKVHPWIRLNRIIRDIPNESIIGGNTITHLRDLLKKEMQKRDLICRCIRCREVKGNSKDIDPSKAELFVQQYEASGGEEFYISIENSTKTVLYGHLRLRINQDPYKNIFTELKGSSMIRELHVYGKLIPIADKKIYHNRAQHKGFGSRLLEKAEEITLDYSLSKIAVISGDGVKEYYRNYHGYIDEGSYLIKHL